MCLRPTLLTVAAFTVALTIATPPLAAAAPDHERALIDQANAAVQAGRWQEAAVAFTQITALDPKEFFLESLGDAQGRLGQYADSVTSYDRAIEAAGRERSLAADSKAVIGRLWTKQGNAQLKLQKFDVAVGLYRRAAEILPDPKTAWFNICAVDYNTGHTEAALADCDKALAVDPGRADAWFIKGSLLIVNATPGKDGAIVAPGAAEALHKYLELAPDGPHAGDVKQMLAYLAGPTKK